MNVDVDPDWDVTESERGGGTLGFAGIAATEAAGAAGLIALDGDEFGPRLPMLPGTWERD